MGKLILIAFALATTSTQIFAQCAPPTPLFTFIDRDYDPFESLNIITPVGTITPGGPSYWYHTIPCHIKVIDVSVNPTWTDQPLWSAEFTPPINHTYNYVQSGTFNAPGPGYIFMRYDTSGATGFESWKHTPDNKTAKRTVDILTAWDGEPYFEAE